MMKFLSVAVFALLFVACGTQGSTVDSSSESENGLPNIVLIVVDDQGYADFDPFSNSDPEISTPNMARLAKTGTVYTQAYVSAPVCSPSRAGILTGKNQFRWDEPASWGPGLPDSVKTIPEYLRDVGYVSSRIGKNDLGRNFHKYDVREYPLNHGYDEFLGFSAHAHDYWLNSTEIKKRTMDGDGTSAVLGPLMHNKGIKSYDEGYLTDILTDEAIEFVERSKDKPFFLTLSYSAVHHLIHEVPQKYLDKYDAKPIPNFDPDSLMAYSKHEAGSYAAYYDKYSRIGAIEADEVRKYYKANLNCLDENVGRFLDALTAANLDENTMIIYVSDNGGSPLTGSNNAPLTGGKYSLWEGGIRVPMSVTWPGHVEAGKTENRYVSALDILPTIAAASKVRLTDPTIDGRSLLALEENRLLVWKWQKTWAVRKGDWKLTNANENHWKSEPSTKYIAPVEDNFELKLFNLRDDSGERNNLASSNPELVKTLQTAYEQWCEANLQKY